VRVAREYVIRRNTRQGGFTLSLRGHWGNLPHPDIESARAAARADAGALTHTIEREGC
jgi:hypothetical protein